MADDESLEPWRCKQCGAVIGYIAHSGYLLCGSAVIEKAKALRCRACGARCRWQPAPDAAGARFGAALERWERYKEGR